MQQQNTTMKKKFVPLTVMCGFVIAFLTACAAIPSSPQPRTFYESLDLDSPESAVTTFTHAFQREDFATVFWVLAPRAQGAWQQHLNLLAYERVIRINPAVERLDAAHEMLEDTPLSSIRKLEHLGDSSYYFDVLMQAAKRHSALLVDLSAKVTILEIRSPEGSEEGEYIDVVTEVSGIAGKVLFRTVQGPSGRWRILQVIISGGDEEWLPWSVPRPVKNQQ